MFSLCMGIIGIGNVAVEGKFKDKYEFTMDTKVYPG
jgi:hypothetical protein